MRRSPADVRPEVLDRLGAHACEVFRWLDVDADGPTAVLRYDLDGLGVFEERFTFDGLDLAGPHDTPAVRGALSLLHLTAGVSYLKAALPPRLDLGPIPVDAGLRDLLGALLVDGLGEFAHVNGLDLRGWFDLPDPIEVAPVDRADAPLDEHPLVPVGGGKDSIVTLEALRPLAPTLFAINPRGPIDRTFDAANLPAVTVTRTLDDRLFAMNDDGALNGHVPVTAIVSSAAVVAAAATGHGSIAMANERSADQANIELDGQNVNHQWSKGSDFEAMFARLVRRRVHPDLVYASFLRPASELAIAKRFADLQTYDRVFNSCNRAFHLRGQTREWCGQCPKCQFVYVALAPFAGRDRLVTIFGRDLLDDPGATEDFAALAGLTDHKPFECVGEIEESHAALACLATRDEWRDRAVVAALADQLGPSCAPLEALMSPPDASDLPTAWQHPFEEAFGVVR